jgi:hypothetical protein
VKNNLLENNFPVFLGNSFFFFSTTVLSRLNQSIKFLSLSPLDNTKKNFKRKDLDLVLSFSHFMEVVLGVFFISFSVFVSGRLL